MTVTSDAPSRGPSGDSEECTGATSSWPRGSWRIVVGVGVALAIAVGIGLRFVATSPLWFDEALTVNIAGLEWSDLPGALKRDGAPPLYYALLHLWIDLFGTSDTAVRALSGVLGVAALPLAWYAGRRIGGRPVAWAALLLLALNPFAIRYSTEARMYSLLALLVFAGILAFRRALERPSLGRLAALGAIVAALLYTHYWAFFLVAVSGLVLLWIAWRGSERLAARRMILAYVAGGVAFLAWVPTLVFQLDHTGTPWGSGRFLGHVLGTTFLEFAGGADQEGWLGWFVLVALVLLGVFGSAAGARRIELDLRGRPEARGEAVVGAGTLALGGLVTWIVDSAFEARYMALVLPFFILLAARGTITFADRRIGVAVLSVALLLGGLGGVRNAVEDRTQAESVAAALDANAAPGDVVVYCPDQLGPSVSRVARDDLVEVTYPRLEDPEIVDWVDYTERVGAVDVATVAAEVRGLAGSHDVFVVFGTTYQTHRGTCEALTSAVAGADRAVSQLVLEDQELIEPVSLVRITDLSAP